MIRSATIQDAGAIARIHIDSWRVAYKGIVDDVVLEELDIGLKTERWMRILSESLSDTYVFESGGKVSAWISYGKCRDDDREGFGEIWALYVSPEEWRHGRGRALISFVEEIASNARTADLTLWVLERNLQGRAFYEKIGYKPDGSVKTFELGNQTLEEIRYRKKVLPTQALEF